MGEKIFNWQTFYKTYKPYHKPHPIVNRFIKSIPIKVNNSLDIGCGYGRYTKLLYDISNETYALDILDLLPDRLKRNVNFVLCDARNLRQLNLKFDLIISMGLIHHFSRETAIKIINECVASLTSRGIFIFNVHSKQDYKFNRGIKIDANSYICDFGTEKGQTHCFFDKEDIFNLLYKHRELKVMDWLSKKGYGCYFVYFQNAD